MSCDFCSKEVIDKQEIFRGSYIRILLPRNPTTRRHFLLIPIRHVAYAHELNDLEIKELFIMQKKIFLVLRDKESCVGYNFFVNNGKKAGQHISHNHFHFFARFADETESPFEMLNKKSELELGDFEFEEIRSYLRHILS